MKPAIKIVFVFLFLTTCSSISLAQNNYLLLNSRMPMHIESAPTLKQGELQWGLGYSAESKSYKSYLEPQGRGIEGPRIMYVTHTVAEDRYQKEGAFKLDYGVFDKLQIGIYISATLIQFGHDHHNINLKYNFNSDETIFPSVSIATTFDGYVGDITITDFSFKAIVSRSFNKFRAHVNIINYTPRTGLVSPGRKFDVGAAVDYNFSDEKLLLLGEVFMNSIPDTRYEYSIGAKKQFGNDFIIYGGIGTAVSERLHPVYNFTAGMTWYGFGFLKELI